MPLSIGIVGLPNVGKSTLFNALTKKQVEADNYPFCTIDPNVGVVKVPDERLSALARISRPKRIINPTIEFIDIAGLVKNAHKGEGLGNKFLHNIRECDAIAMVIRNFEDKNIVHVNNAIDPISDQETIKTELVMADLETVGKTLTRLEKEAKSRDKKIVKQRSLAEMIRKQLDSGKNVRELELGEEEEKYVKTLNLLSYKPIIYIFNSQASENEKKFLTELNDGEILSLNIKQEEEIAGLEENEQKEFIKELGLGESGLDKLIKRSYRLLGLMTFFTTGPEETRGWTIKKGAKAPRAAGVIHTDFEKGFIRAEVVNWKKLVDDGSEQTAREKGHIRTEGKDYVMQDGDVCHFLFNK